MVWWQGLATGTILLLATKGVSSRILEFDEELFFIYLLPPIIFNAGYGWSLTVQNLLNMIMHSWVSTSNPWLLRRWIYCNVVVLRFTRFQVKKKHFFRNFTTINLFGAVGTMISFCIISFGTHFTLNLWIEISWIECC